MDADKRTSNGRFAVGNPGGPGRPRRAVEREYLATLGEAVSLDEWRDICRATVEAAKKGDARARDWLAKHLLGENPLSLTALAADEAAQLDAEQDIVEQLAQRNSHRDNLELLGWDDLQTARSTLERFLKARTNKILPESYKLDSRD